MDDLISRKEAIRLILKQNVVDKSVFKRLLMQLPSAQPEERWVPVSERLPGNSGYYLVTCGDDARSQEVDLYHHEMNRFVMYDVIAWMPLPEPYKAERREE